MTTTTITEVDRIRRLPWLVVGDVLNITFVLFTFSGPIFVLFLDALELDNAQIGFMLSLVPFAGIIAPFVAPVAIRYGYKRTFITFWGIRKFVIALLLLTPAITLRFGPGKTFYWVAGIFFAFALCRAFAEAGSYPWKKEVVPDSIRGKFAAISSMSTTITSIIVTTGASFVIDAGTGLNRFMILIAIGIALGLLGVWAYSHVPAEDAGRRLQPHAGHLRGMWQALHDKDFIFFLAALGLATIGGTSIISFVPLYMKTQVGLSEGNVVLLSIGTYLGALITSYLWGWAADRYGSQPVMQTSLYMMLVLPVAWFLMPRHSPMSIALAMSVAFLAGIATLAWQISWMRYLFINAMPTEQRSSYTALYYAWYGLVSGLGPLLAGQILDLSQNIGTQFFIFTIDAYTSLFVLSVTLLTVSSVLVSRLRSEDATPFRRFAGMFVRGNPVRAMQSLIQYNLSGDEMTRLVVTERMGDAKSLLSTNELIEAMNDPSFNVRYQAINSIGRMPSDPELVDALLAMLDESPSELSFVITRSLGRLGDKRAIKPLRKLLFSGYHLLEANSARALAMLGDVESIPHLIEKLNNEPSPTLRVAYATALGKLHATEAIADLFTLLRQTKAEVLRGEIGLALARMAGDERYYMQHWRSFHANPETATAQAILALQKLIKPPKDATTLVETCAHHFAEGNPARGAASLREILEQWPTENLNPTLTAILHGCIRGLADFGGSRLEYILLSLHILDLAMRENVILREDGNEWLSDQPR
ncbi:MAG: MFS transporter [Anaerolineae bacterium]|nr:MFS transporter [Anaerolineae bacterium]